MLIIDPMHNLYMGTAKYMLDIWKSKGIITAANICEINQRITSLSIPSNVRFARSSL